MRGWNRKVRRVDLSPYGLEGGYVVVVDVMGLTLREFNELAQEARGETIGFGKKEAELILEWNLEDEEGRLPLPKDDPSVVERIPVSLFLAIKSEMYRMPSVEEIVPKGAGRS